MVEKIKIIKKYWSKNKLISYKNFAIKWLKEFNAGEITCEKMVVEKFKLANLL